MADIEIVSNGAISNELKANLQLMARVELMKAENEEREAFEEPVWTGFGHLIRQTDGKIFYKTLDW